VRAGEDYEIAVSYASPGLEGDIEDGRFSLAIANSRGVTVLLVGSDFSDQRVTLRRNGGRMSCVIRDFNLAPGEYTVTLFVGRLGGEVLDCLLDTVGISVVGGDYFGTGHPGLPEHCSTLTRATWSWS
jgi:lipopolysaccharide transport system ATP-binding protein